MTRAVKSEVKILKPHAYRSHFLAHRLGRGLLFACLCIGLLSLCLRPGAHADVAKITGLTGKTPYATASLLREDRVIAPGQTFWLALRLDIIPHWHVYWRNSGDSGEPTRLQWTLPTGFSVAEPLWPVPSRQRVEDLVNYGYAGQSHLFIKVTPPADLPVGRPVALKLKANWLVCEEICIPEEASFTINLPVAAKSVPDPADAVRIAKARQTLPQAAPAELTALASATQEGGNLTLKAPALAELDPANIRDVYFFPFDPELIAHSAPQKWTKRDDELVVALMPGAVEGKLANSDWAGIITIDLKDAVAGGLGQNIDAADRQIAFELRALNSAVSPADRAANLAKESNLANETGAQQSSLSFVADGAQDAQGPEARRAPDIGPRIALWTALALAFGGGLLLNLMPCVFPILFVKAASFARAGAYDAGRLRREGVAYLTGVLTTFVLIGGLLAILRQSGQTLGWGYQLQSPLVIAILALLMSAIGFNLMGFFEISGRFQNFGARYAALDGSSGAFFTGALTVLVATPCLAPGMGAALGYVLAAPPLTGMLVFIALGLGLGLPFALLSWIPALHRLLPRPGAWMDGLKQFFAFPMFATAIWLLWVLVQQTGPDGLAAALLLILIFAFGVWIARLQVKGRVARATRIGVMLGVLVSASYCLTQLWPEKSLAGSQIVDAQASQSASASPLLKLRHGVAEPWSEARVAEILSEGRPVFVDVTAAWCTTCRINSARAIDRPNVAAAFTRTNSVLLVADWTKRDARISQMLTKYGQAGVPLYVVYSPRGDRRARILPTLLSEKIVVEALELAASP